MKPYYETELGKLYHGDCLQIMPQLEPVDLVLTDPPYGVGIEYGEKYKDSYESWVALTSSWLPIGLKINRKGLILTPGGLEQERFLWIHHPPKWRICWYKGAQAQRSPIGFKHWENIFVYGETKSQCPDYFLANPPPANNGHPCPKPTKFYKWLLKEFSLDGEIILDPFLGSGTMAVTCENFKRRWIGIEIEEKYCEIAAKRIEQECKQLKLF